MNSDETSGQEHSLGPDGTPNKVLGRIIILLTFMVILSSSCSHRMQRHFTAESLRFVRAERAVVFRLHDKNGDGAIEYLVARPLPKDFAARLEEYFRKHGNSMTGGVTTVESFDWKWSNTESRNDDICMTFRRPVTPGEVDISWSTPLPYRSAFILRESDLPASLITNQSIEITFASYDVTYQHKRGRSFHNYTPGP
jgi:hypothetical protein